MAGDTSTSRIVYLKDERGVIVDSAVVVGDDDVPEGFSDSAEYESYVPSPTEAAPVDESKLTTWEGVDLSATVDAIKESADAQEGATDPAALRSEGVVKGKDKVQVEGTVSQTDTVVTPDDGSSEHDSSQTVDAVKNANDQQEGATGEDSVGEDDDKPRRGSRKASEKSD